MLSPCVRMDPALCIHSCLFQVFTIRSETCEFRGGPSNAPQEDVGVTCAETTLPGRCLPLSDQSRLVLGPHSRNSLRALKPHVAFKDLMVRAAADLGFHLGWIYFPSLVSSSNLCSLNCFQSSRIWVPFFPTPTITMGVFQAVLKRRGWSHLQSTFSA